MEQSLVKTNRAALPSDVMIQMMRYKRWADAELMNAAGSISGFGRALVGRYVVAIVRHFHTVDCIFRAHLLGVAHGYTSANPPEPKSLAELHERVAAIDEWYVEYARELDARHLGEALDITFTDGERQILTRSDILLHVAQHGAYHRGNVGILLRVGGAGALPDRFTSYLHQASSKASTAG
jgi:uncharacterized damage-inducible protein DinB